MEEVPGIRRGSCRHTEMWQASAESREGSTEQQPGRRGHRVPAPPGLGVTGTETAVQARIQEEQGFTSQLLVLLRKPELPHRRRPKEEASHEGKHTDVADPPHKQKKKKKQEPHTHRIPSLPSLAGNFLFFSRFYYC